MLTLKINCTTLEDAERVLATLKLCAPPAVCQVAEPDNGHPSFADAQAALKAVRARHGEDLATVSAILGRFNAERVSDVKQADYVDFMAACAAA